MKNLKTFKMFETYVDHNGKDVGIEGGETIIRKQDGKKGTIRHFRYSKDETSTEVSVEWEDKSGSMIPLDRILDNNKFEIKK